jgi:crooked neck
MAELPAEERADNLLIQFARFEERCKEYERAKIIFQFAIDELKQNNTPSDELNKEYIAFEKRHGNRESIEDVIITNRRQNYELILQENNYNYDTWFDLCKLEENEKNYDKIRDVYERAISNIPPIAEKRYWKRYIYLWISYAIFEEIDACDYERTRNVYRECLRVIPHDKFTFGKVWTMAAHFEVRQKDLAAARKLFGKSIGLCPKENLFKSYISLELQLGEIERCRTIYGKYLEFMPFNCSAWQAFAQLEASVGETTRARYCVRYYTCICIGGY